MKLLKTGLLFLFIASATAAAYEPERNASCYACSAYEKQNIALTKAYSLGAAQSRINVIDLSNASVITFRYQSASYQDGFGDVLGPGSESILIAPSSQSVRNATREAADFVASQGIVYPSGREGIRNSADFVNHAQKNRVIDDWINDEHRFTWYATNLLSIFGGAAFDILKGIQIRVRFEDGSEIEIKSFDWNGPNKTFNMVYVEGSALDADSNEVPTRIGDYTKTFFLTERHVESWIENAQRNGVSVVRSYTRTGTPDRPLQTSCPPVGNNRYRCEIVPRSEDAIGPE